MLLDRRLFLAAAAAASAAPATHSTDDPAATIQRQAQALYDAVGSGQAAVWTNFLHENASCTDEEGNVSTKAQMVAQVTGLPSGISGNITVMDFHAHRTGNIIVANYVSDEHENYFGARLHCQYRNTDTWLSTPHGWRLLAMQTMALRTDPPDVSLTPSQWDDYAGRYKLSDDVSYEITRTAGGVQGQQTGGRARPLKAEARDVLFNPGRPRYRFVFPRDADGRITGMNERREAWDIVWTRLS
jgi:hypothetical protein